VVHINSWLSLYVLDGSNYISGFSPFLISYSVFLGVLFVLSLLERSYTSCVALGLVISSLSWKI
jgi:hypothetical protein